MDQPLEVSGVEPGGRLAHQLHPLGERERRGQYVERPPLDELEEDAGATSQRAHLEDPHHMGVLDAGLEARLEQEPLGVPGIRAAHELHGDGALERHVPGGVDLAHAALAEQLPQLHPAIQRPEFQAHGQPPRGDRCFNPTPVTSPTAPDLAGRVSEPDAAALRTGCAFHWAGHATLPLATGAESGSTSS